MLEPTQQYSLWGQAFEIAVKRGVLTALLASRIGNLDKLDLKAWKAIDTADVYEALAVALQEVDPNLRARTRETARHIFELGMGLGQTALREYLQRLEYDPEDYCLKALWCPLQLPRLAQKDHFDSETEAALQDFTIAFAQEHRVESALAFKGFPARADFLLWLDGSDEIIDREFLCLEFSLNGLPETADYRESSAHLDELRRFAWFMDTRSVFSRVCAEVSNEEFTLSPAIKRYLPAFTGRDKPLYKLCQAASYVHTSMRWLEHKGFKDKPCNARALSITQNGFESLCARFFTKSALDPRTRLLEELGRAYRDSEKLPEQDEEALNDYIRYAFNTIRKAMPDVISKQFLELREVQDLGKNLAFDFSEEVEGFLNPMEKLSWHDALSMVDTEAAITEFLGTDPKAAISNALAERGVKNRSVPLRSLHAAAVVAGMRASAFERITVLGLEGNPGIGKTTAVVSYLKESDAGFLFLYVSPRVIINDDVTENLARDRNTQKPTGILTVTTNSKLIGAANAWYEKQGEDSQRRIDSAVVVDGVEDLKTLDGSTWILSPEQKEELELTHIGANHRKRSLTERVDEMNDVKRPGVLKVLSHATRELLDKNPNINQVVLTAAIQGYRELGGNKSTLSALDKLFKDPVNSRAGKQQRSLFAQRIPTIVVMVDELTGDGAGSLFIHDVFRWLNSQFVQPFCDSPLFRVILIISDASLGNEVVLDRYLNSGSRTPDKVLVSQSAGKRPFRLATTPVRIGGKQTPVLHIMTNSYPAAKLIVDYQVRLDLVKPGEFADGKTQTVRQAIAEQQGEALIGNVVNEIKRALNSGSDQIIFFAQDKAFLRAVQTALINPDDTETALVDDSQVAILDSSVTPTKRKALIADNRRDTVKVFLMTSSGARGVSFPKTDWIIALIPRFGIEAALMEVAQLIYRGRGERYTTDEGSIRNDGDWKNRRLVMLLQDFMPQEDKPEPRQWLRQVSDLLTYLVMLRSTIYTRIVGDAGLDKQNLALVPVGGIGSAEMLSLMSTHIREFLQESDVILRDHATNQQQRGLVVSAQQNILRLFSKFSLEGTAQLKEFKSVARLEDIQAFSRRASSDNAPLLVSPIDDRDCLLPDHIYCIGPFWLERWDKVDKQERLSVEGWSTDVDHYISDLFGALKHIFADESLPFKLRKPAEELYRILARDKQSATREFSTVKTLKSPFSWLVVPLDYARFWKKDANGRLPSLGSDEVTWRDSLAACIPSSSAEILPVIPRYADIPYAAVIGEQDPARLDLIFDDRYLAASNELNLLNTILLADSRD